MNEKRCANCKVIKPFSEYYSDKRSRDGLLSSCKTCHGIRASTYRKNNPDKVRAMQRNWISNAVNRARTNLGRQMKKFRKDHIIVNEKICTKCKVLKPSNDFYTDLRRKDSMMSRCKLCHNKMTKRWKENNKDCIKLTNKLYDSRPENIQKRIERKKKFNRSHKGLAANRLNAKVQRVRYPNRVKARKTFWTAIKAGKIIRPSQCSNCHKKCKPHGHHHKGYDGDNWKQVIWLCPKCHRDIHKPLP